MPDFLPLILGHFAASATGPIKPKDLAIALGVKKSQLSPFKAAIEQLIEAGQLRRTTLGEISAPRAVAVLTGTIKRSTSGSGTFREVAATEAADAEGEESEDPAAASRGPSAEITKEDLVFISPEDMHGALTGDTVRVALSRRRRTGGQRIGRVVEILERAKSTFVGTYHESHGQGFVSIDGGAFDEPVSVGDPGAKGVKPSDKVVVEIVHYPTSTSQAEGVITRVLGPHGEPGVDCLSIIHEFNLPDEFPESVLDAAREEVRSFDESNLEGRLDLTGETIITIDPVDARDFDDAISLTQDEQGHWRLGVHIADVSHFVRPGTPLDREAQKRGTSVYLPDRVLPMLPEQISNGLASLQEGHVRYTKSVFIDFDPSGLPLSAEFANSVIKTVRRFAYEEIMPILREPDQPHERVTPAVLALLQRMFSLAMILRQRRFAGGALDLQLPEVKIDFDADGRVAGAHRVVNDESHQIIEEFMLAANIAVASKFAEKGLPYLHRVHATPDEQKLKTLGNFVNGLGLKSKPWMGRQEIRRLLDEVRGQPTEYAVSYAVLRSLKQAEYSPADTEHFALNERFYCHFTSPIRRYPDLLVHRLFDRLARGGKGKFPSEAQLVRLGEHCSETERRAESAERELTKVKLLAYLADKVGWKYTATITGVERFGIFCVGLELPVDGLVHVRNLPNDNYDYDEKHHLLVGRRTGQVFRLGDRIQVEVAKVDTHRRNLDLKWSPGEKRPPREVRSGGQKSGNVKKKKRR